MFTQLRKQLWFVGLMVLSIGWSSVSFASVEVMRMTMQHEQMQSVLRSTSEPHAMMEDISIHKAKQDQADSLIMQQNASDCHTQESQTKSIQASECQDCTFSSCQSSVIWFNEDIPQMVTFEHFKNRQHYQADYTAQHLAGFWQEILRPPKV